MQFEQLGPLIFGGSALGLAYVFPHDNIFQWAAILAGAAAVTLVVTVGSIYKGITYNTR